MINKSEREIAPLRHTPSRHLPLASREYFNRPSHAHAFVLHRLLSHFIPKPNPPPPPANFYSLAMLYPMNININKSVNDPFYRYKMPALQTSSEANRTVLSNLDQVAKSLCRDPQLILKFIGTSLGCSQIKDPSKYALKGHFDTKRLQQLIYEFIDLFVLCASCGNPETHFVFEEDLKRGCNSCGAVCPQEAHRLNAAILRNIEKGVNEDTKYSKSNGTDISELIRGSEDSAAQIYDLYKQESMGLADLFTDYFKPAGIKQLRLVIAEHSATDVLENIENMLESHGKDDKIENFLKALVKIGISIDSIDEYFRIPKKGKKRSPLIKKNAEYYINNFDN